MLENRHVTSIINVYKSYSTIFSDFSKPTYIFIINYVCIYFDKKIVVGQLLLETQKSCFRVPKSIPTK